MKPKSFKQRQRFYSKVQRLQLRWQPEYHLLMAPLYLMLPAPYRMRNVVELGCADGRFAVQALHDLPTLVTWWGYDIAEQWIQQSLRHPRYTPHLLKKPLWEQPIDRFHVFMSSHTVEHLYPPEVEALAAWLGKHCRIGVVLSVPSPERVYGGHVLGKPSSWIINLMQDHKFRLVWETGGWIGWFIKQTYVSSSSRETT